MAQNLRKHHIPFCAKKKFFSIFNTEKLNFSENLSASNCVRSSVV